MSPYTYWITNIISDTCSLSEYTGVLMQPYPASKTLQNYLQRHVVVQLTDRERCAY